MLVDREISQTDVNQLCVCVLFIKGKEGNPHITRNIIFIAYTYGEQSQLWLNDPHVSFYSLYL